MPVWLWRSIVGVASTTALLVIMQWAACMFYVMPKVWPWYAKYKGTTTEEIQMPSLGCDDASGRSVAALMALLTTLISLSRQADDR